MDGTDGWNGLFFDDVGAARGVLLHSLFGSVRTSFIGELECDYKYDCHYLSKTTDVNSLSP